MIEYTNPEGVHAPAGSYSHGVLLPPGARTLLISGQVGLRPDGGLAESVEDQAEQIYRNLGAILRAHGMDFTDVVRLNTYMLHGQSADAVIAARRRHMPHHRPAATFIYVSQLFSPDWFLEVDAVAARP